MCKVASGRYSIHGDDSRGENPLPGIDPAQRTVGIRVRRSSECRKAILEYRSRFLVFESRRVLGLRKPSSANNNAFGARNFQPHVSLLRPGSGIDRDLTQLGMSFRKEFSTLTFDKFRMVVRTVRNEL